MTPSRYLVALFLLATLSTAHADENAVSPTRARAAVAAGLIKPLPELLTTIETGYSGQVIEAELLENGGHWAYEFELLPTDGRLFLVVLDAASGAVIRTHGPVQEKR
jgi:uncharacterized membrane protein YkoI